MTSLIGFVYRQCDEFELDDGEPTTPLDNYDDFMDAYNSAVGEATVSGEWLNKFRESAPAESELTSEQIADRLKHTRLFERGSGFKKRLIVRQFLDSMFLFNPDKHVRSAYVENLLDPERNSVSESNAEFVKHTPPADVFHRWTYYTDSNYEELREAVKNLYADKPDLEFAINPYGQFNSQEEAAAFVQKHKGEIITDVLTLTNSKWNLCGSFKSNRERINFYNENTAIIEEIFKQLEQDKKLGADLMRKRVKRKKKKNIEESGPDPAEFKQYKRDFPSGFSAMGAEDISLDEKTSKPNAFENHEDCPNDSIQVDVFDFKRGGQTVRKSEFFTESESPQDAKSKEIKTQ